MEVDQIIEQLNMKENIATITISNLEQAGLTEEEKAFIKTYQPEKALIIYGTLAPGRPNHHVVEHIKGAWQQGIVHGKLKKEGWGSAMGYNGFIHVPVEEQEDIQAFVLFSDELNANWKMLDEFEGDGYKRILAPFKLEKGAVGVGYIYAINE